MTADAAELYWKGWCERVLAGFPLEQCGSPIDLRIWFDRIAAVDDQSGVNRNKEVPRVSRRKEGQQTDPQLGLGNWRDAEFRAWLAGQIQDRDALGVRPQKKLVEVHRDNTV